LNFRRKEKGFCCCLSNHKKGRKGGIAYYFCRSGRGGCKRFHYSELGSGGDGGDLYCILRWQARLVEKGESRVLTPLEEEWLYTLRVEGKSSEQIYLPKRRGEGGGGGYFLRKKRKGMAAWLFDPGVATQGIGRRFVPRGGGKGGGTQSQFFLGGKGI